MKWALLVLFLLSGCVVRNCVCRKKGQDVEYKCVCMEHGVYKPPPPPPKPEEKH